MVYLSYMVSHKISFYYVHHNYSHREIMVTYVVGYWGFCLQLAHCTLPWLQFIMQMQCDTAILFNLALLNFLIAFDSSYVYFS